MDQPAVMESMTTADAADAIEALLNSTPAPEPKEKAEAAESEEAEESTEVDAEESDEEESDEKPESESQEPQIESIADLAEALEMSVEDLQATLKAKIKVNGEELEVTLDELAKGYQKDADYRQKTSELAKQRTAFTEAYQQANERLTQEFTQLGQIMQVLEQFAVKAPDQKDMDYLRQTDPSRYLMAKAEYEEQKGYFTQLKTAASQAYQQHAQQLMAMQEAQRSQLLQKAMEDLPARVPDWSAERKTALDNYLTSDHYGYTPQELAQILDPRLVEIVNKAFLYDTQAKKVESTKEKVKTLPKFAKPTKPTSVAPKASNLAKAKARLGKTGHLNDAAAAIANLF